MNYEFRVASSLASRDISLTVKEFKDFLPYEGNMF